MPSLQALMAEILKLPESRIAHDAEMKDIAQWDSLKHMELILAIEQRYAIELTGDEIADMISVKAIKGILARHGV